MTNLSDLMIDNDMVAVGTVPIQAGLVDYADADGKVVLFVRDMPEGRSLFLGMSLYGEVTRMYELEYSAWEDTIMKMTTDVAVSTIGGNE